MRFTIRAGNDSVARADGVMLRALGLPSGGIIRLGETHLEVHAGSPSSPTELLVGADALANSGLTVGASANVERVVLGAAEIVRFSDHPIDSRHLNRALMGRPLTTGDVITIDPGYIDNDEAVELTVLAVEPDGAGLVGAPTRFAIGNAPPAPVIAAAPSSSAVSSSPAAAGERKDESGTAGDETSSSATAEENDTDTPTIEEALLAGLDNELDMMTGWLSLLATKQDLASVWNLPAVAGVLLEGPNGCGKSELVGEAARRAGTNVTEVDISKVFKPESLLDKLAAAVNDAVAPQVVFVDRLETLTGDDALSTFRTQFVAVLRWFLDEIAAKKKVVCVLGVASVADLHESVADSTLLPRTVTIPPPDLDRRKLLFQAALAHVPSDDEIDYDRLAALASGFSGADILASVVNASSVVAGRGGALDNEAAMESVKSTQPSLGSVPMGEITGFGFEKVANLTDVKQRLTEAVIWPISQPERYDRLGIEPPKGILLHGPPGTGKTFVVKALAHEAGCAFFAVKGAELLDKYVGESERAVRDVFSRARDAAPSIIFFDEFDALAPVRGGNNSGVSDRVVASLLTEIDGVADRGRVAVIAATNRKDLIDGALLRAGRLEAHIELGLPGKEGRLALLNITDVNLEDDVDLDVLAQRTDGLSFADLAGVLREGALAALRTDAQAMAVGWEHLESALELFEDRRGAITYD